MEKLIIFNIARNFINIQSSHTVSTKGAHQPLIGTGYETLLADRVSSIFAYVAKKNGVVSTVNEHGVTITYDDGEVVFVKAGRLYGRAEGSYYLHDVVCDLKVGDSFKKGDGVTYNKGFFEPDALNKKNLVWKSGVLAKVAFMDTIQTFEDSSVITKSLADKLEAPTLKVHSYVLGFDQDVSKVRGVGERVEPEDVLFYIRDSLLANSGLFNETTLESLKKLTGKAPKAKYRGVIERIEVYYNGSKDDMSDSLRKLADASDKRLGIERQASGKSLVTGQVGMDYRIAGKSLLADNVEIKVFILVTNAHGIGDKLVLSHALKSVVGDVIMEDMTTENGDAIDMIFSYRSVANRIVTSPIINGVLGSLLEHYRRKVVTEFFA